MSLLSGVLQPRAVKFLDNYCRTLLCCTCNETHSPSMTLASLACLLSFISILRSRTDVGSGKRTKLAQIFMTSLTSTILGYFPSSVCVNINGKGCKTWDVYW